MSRRNGPSNFLLLILIVLVGTFLVLDQPWAGKVGSKEDVEAIIDNYIQNNPDRVVAAFQKKQEKDRAAQAEQAKKAMAENYDKYAKNPHSPYVGNENGDIVIVEFFDYQCGYCKKVLPDITKLIEDDKNIKFVFKELPILGPGSEVAAKAALAVNSMDRNKYFAYHSALMSFQGQKTEAVVLDLAKKVGINPEKLKEEMNKPEIVELLATNRQLADKAGIRGTPGFLIGQNVFPGAMGLDAFKAEVKKARDAKNG